VKIYDGAVLLIIGAAVIGPITPQSAPRTAEMRAEQQECLTDLAQSEEDTLARRFARSSQKTKGPWMGWAASHGPIPCYVWPRDETAAETCERAMKEAGVENSYAGLKPDGTFYPEGMSWSYPGASDALTGQPTTVIKKPGGNGFDNKMLIGHAYCIPAPTGLAR